MLAKPSGFWLPLLFAVVGGVTAYMFTVVLVAKGGAIFVPGLGFPMVCVALGVLVLLMAIRVWRSSRGKGRHPLNLHFAFRTLVLAKSCILAGSLLIGVCLGLAFYLSQREVLPASSVVVELVLATSGAVILGVLGAVSEWLCRIPKAKSDEQSPATPEPGVS